MRNVWQRLVPDEDDAVEILPEGCFDPYRDNTKGEWHDVTLVGELQKRWFNAKTGEYRLGALVRLRST